jgi:hypothetical protein
MYDHWIPYQNKGCWRSIDVCVPCSKLNLEKLRDPFYLFFKLRTEVI